MQVVVHIMVANAAVTTNKPLGINVEKMHISRRHLTYLFCNASVDRGNFMPQWIVTLTTRSNALQINASI